MLRTLMVMKGFVRIKRAIFGKGSLFFLMKVIFSMKKKGEI